MDAHKTSLTLFQGRRYLHALFFIHLALEKALKGYFVKINKKEAPYTHNLQAIALAIPDHSFTTKQLVALTQITTFNIATRYDDYKNSLAQTVNRAFVKKYLTLTEELLACIRSQMK